MTHKELRDVVEEARKKNKTTTLVAVFKNAAAERLFSVYGGCNWSQSPRFGSPATWDGPRVDILHDGSEHLTVIRWLTAVWRLKFLAMFGFNNPQRVSFFFFYPATDDIMAKHRWKYLNGTNVFLYLDSAGVNRLELCGASSCQLLVWLLSNKGGRVEETEGSHGTAQIQPDFCPIVLPLTIVQHQA